MFTRSHGKVLFFEISCSFFCKDDAAVVFQYQPCLLYLLGDVYNTQSVLNCAIAPPSIIKDSSVIIAILLIFEYF